MTALAVLTQPARGVCFMVSDAALYDSESGVIVRFDNKTAVVDHWPGAVSNSGNADATFLAVEALGAAFPTWDAMVDGAEDLLARVVPSWSLRSGADVLLAGISAKRGPEAFTFRIDDTLPETASRADAAASKYWANKPFQLVRLGRLVMTPVPDDQIIPADWEGIADDADDASVEWSMRKLLTMQRHMALPDSIGGIGGFATITKVTAGGVEQRTLIEWPEDQTGGWIRPPRIFWRRWHIDNPRPKRPRASRRGQPDKRLLTAQRLALLGETATAADRRREVELKLQAADLAGIKLTDMQIEKVKRYAQEQQSLAETQKTLGVLGSAATEAERYAARVQELGIALAHDIITQEQFNRALAAAHPLYESLQSAATNFATGFASDLRSGVSAMDALTKATSRLTDSLINIALNKAISSLFSNLGGIFGGSLGTIGGTGLPGYGGRYHTGGIVGVDSVPGRYVHPAYFDDAPRFHSGGIMPGEYPAILQRGEGVFTKAQMAALGRGGASGVTVVVNNNAGDDVSVGEPRRGADGGLQIDVAINRAVKNALQSDLASHGPMSQSIGRRFGLDPTRGIG